MTSRCEAILITLKSVGDEYDKHYSWPSQEKILELLERFHGILVSRRTLNRDLGWLEENGFIERLRRHFRNRRGQLILRSTLYFLKRKAHKVFNSLWNWLNWHHHRFPVTKMAQHETPKRNNNSRVRWFGSNGEVIHEE